MVNNENFTNKNVKYLRETNNIPQSKLAKDLKIDQSTLAKWENSTRQITLDWAIKISDYFKIGIGDFISKDLHIKTISSIPTTDEEYKEILKEKGLMDENENIDKEDFKKLIEFAVANKDYLIKKDETKE
ncbi:MAG: helix-turn-helix transcriptional regulator [Firmicutes bacterium]|nr:helix-turn-helix transcriptional regulator [Bacillota bacterium]